MSDELSATRALESDLSFAVSRRQLELHYQPFVSAQESCVTGFEALVRWRHPERGLVSPEQFIHLAERTPLICEIGVWVLREACRAARVAFSAGAGITAREAGNNHADHHPPDIPEDGQMVKAPDMRREGLVVCAVAVE